MTQPWILDPALTKLVGLDVSCFRFLAFPCYFVYTFVHVFFLVIESFISSTSICCEQTGSFEVCILMLEKANDRQTQNDLMWWVVINAWNKRGIVESLRGRGLSGEA